MKFLLFALFTTTIASSIATEIISSNHHPITTTNQRYTIYEGCGKSSKTCLGIPENCVPQRSCHAVTTLTLVDEKYIFEMQTGYNYPHFIATALSWDDQMGDDAVMECVRENGTIQMYASWTTVRPYNATRIPPDHLRLLNSSRIDGTIYCKIEHEPVIRVRGRTFDLTNGKHYLLLAAGHGLRNDSISFHNIGKAASNEVIDLRVKEEFPGASRLFIRLHGALMVIAWMGSGSVGILLARHFKETWEQWLVWHKMCSFTTWLLTIAGFIIIFLEVRGWSQVENPHAVLGVITTFICFLQPISALIQQEMTDKETRFFYWFHKISGEMSHIFAMMTIFFSVNLPRAELPSWMHYVLTAYVAVHVTMNSMFSITSMQKVLLAIYSILILLFVISILVIVGWNPQTDNNILSAAEQLYYVK